jgi:hypothetical protein
MRLTRLLMFLSVLTNFNRSHTKSKGFLIEYVACKPWCECGWSKTKRKNKTTGLKWFEIHEYGNEADLGFVGAGRSIRQESDAELASSTLTMRQGLASKRRGLRPPTYEVVDW